MNSASSLTISSAKSAHASYKTLVSQYNRRGYSSERGPTDLVPLDQPGDQRVGRHHREHPGGCRARRQLAKRPGRTPGRHHGRQREQRLLDLPHRLHPVGTTRTGTRRSQRTRRSPTKTARYSRVQGVRERDQQPNHFGIRPSRHGRLLSVGGGHSRAPLRARREVAGGNRPAHLRVQRHHARTRARRRRPTRHTRSRRRRSPPDDSGIDRLYVASFRDSSRLFRYNLRHSSYIDSMPLSPVPGGRHPRPDVPQGQGHVLPRGRPNPESRTHLHGPTLDGQHSAGLHEYPARAGTRASPGATTCCCG